MSPFQLKVIICQCYSSLHCLTWPKKSMNVGLTLYKSRLKTLLSFNALCFPVKHIVFPLEFNALYKFGLLALWSNFPYLCFALCLFLTIIFVLSHLLIQKINDRTGCVSMRTLNSLWTSDIPMRITHNQYLFDLHNAASVLKWGHSHTCVNLYYIILLICG